MTTEFLFLTVGLLMLYFGSLWLVEGSASLASSLGIRPIVIGLTVVAFGTSAPELVISLVSAVKGKSMIAVGNVIGSNICNIALVLGLAAVLNPIKSHPTVLSRDIPLMLAISVYLLLLSLNSTIGRLEGLSLVAGIVLYTWYNYSIAVKDAPVPIGVSEAGRDTKPEVTSRRRQTALIVAGIAGVVIGANFLVDAAVNIMSVFGVSEKFIGLTVVAFGTSLPELATSIMAAYKGEMDISIGNLLGSNVFNILSVLGAAALVRPIHIPGGFIESGLLLDYLVMMLTSFLPWLMMRKTLILSRVNGLTLIGCYIGYVAYLVMKG
jgi:cation:H+ antiporter